MERKSMREFWDARAEEDAYFFVDNRLRYGDPDIERFWAGGVDVVENCLAMLDLTIGPTDEIVEIGCGVGRLTRPLARLGGHVSAVDVSPQMIGQARELNPDLANVEWIHGDGHTLSGISSNSVDVCFSFVVFQHVPDAAITLDYVREMGRVLRPGGWAAFQVSNLPAVHSRRSFWRRAGDQWRGLRNRGPRGQDHPAWLGSAVSLVALRAAAAGAGAEITRITGEGTQYCLVSLREGHGDWSS